MIVDAVVGPPGTGKTTVCIDEVRRAVAAGTDPKDIAYLSFSTRAAKEPKDRIKDLTADDMLWFRTIHSAVFVLEGFSRDVVMGKSSFDRFCSEAGVDSAKQVDLLDDATVYEYGNSTAVAMALDHLARNLMVDVSTVWADHDCNVSLSEVDYILDKYREWKAGEGYVDFTDMLELSTAPMPCKIAIIDEAQDLTPLQWNVVDTLCRNADRMVIVGDDDQAIYTWAGADPAAFYRRVQHADSVRTLDHSYRLTQCVYNTAMSVLSNITERLDKKFTYNSNVGTVVESEIDDLPLGSGTWLLLARSNYQLRDYIRRLKELGMPFSVGSGGTCVCAKVADAVSTWHSLMDGSSVTANAVKNMYDYMVSGSGVARGGKSSIAKAEGALTLANLRADHGLTAEGDWWNALCRVPVTDVRYIRDIESRGESIGSPRIKVSSIHAAKGGEADNVAIMTDVSRKIADAMAIDPDNEHRVFYVAVTRAIANLYIIPQDTNLSYQLQWKP